MSTATNIARSCIVGIALWLFAPASQAQLVVIVSAKSPLTLLGENEVADIYLGRGTEMMPIDQADDSASRADFYKLVLRKSPAQLRAYWSKLIFTGRGQPPREVGDVAAIKKLVSGDSHAIGYIDKSELDSTVKAVLTLH
ncbi:phosphate ABC transporter substrate-binding protein [Trinickia sp. LjRoot230]|uniref:phosphate ABC transporter substrate-binding protein n=1 Tax=Trinickia sp. LjRoot230 TaxID=3342288 RepID=UPI003ECEDF41